ncbi:tetratricopeptide repeat protein [Virgibacillus alimentarius]|uniref:Tetratricopeptide (TPR) repeat protein n=1 Tax=Virgibacillus alimentarius TaxID=698769 RepID=A0ABS4S8U4_9BACI|nr:MULTISPECIES: hypothetical protein [Virgibacillus]MBP2256822.1 tetratricopeptide (TPR) repeat protein [Virgibacillus alimentarius]HLR65691.1 hypothetical protein [Virgibacillus sp.]
MQQVKQKEKLKNIIPFIPEGDFYFTKGIEAFQKRKFELAIKWMNKAIEAKPKETLYACQLSIIYTEIGQYHKANQLLTNILKSTTYVDCYYLLANNYAHLGLLNDARKYANLYLEKTTDDEFKEEAENLLQLIDIGENDDDGWELDHEDELLIYQETAFYHMENCEWEKVIPLLEEMMTLFPEHKTTKHDYAHALFFSGYEEEAVEMELELLQVDPNTLYCHTNLALFFYKLNKKEAYKANIQALLNVYPIHEQQQLRIAITLVRTGYYKEAYQRFCMLSKGIVTDQLSYYRWFSVAAFHMGKTFKATSIWEEGCRKYPQLSQEKSPWQ